MLFKVIIAILLAVAAGLATGPDGALWGISLVKFYGLIGQLFLNALSLVVVPLVAASIVTGMARMGKDQSFGVLGLKTFGAFVATSLTAIVVGLLMALLIAPGTLTQIDASAPLVDLAAASDPLAKVEQILFKLVPSNILAAASQGQMLGLILFSMLFGYFMNKIDAHAGEVLLQAWQAVLQVMMKITHLIMKAMPLGVFGLVAKAVAMTGVDTLGAVAWFFATVLGGLAVYAFILLPLLLKFVARVNPIAHYRAMVPALVTAFSTSSSAATLPVTLECMEQRAGVSNRVCSFVLPLGTSVNLSGSALYVCVGVLFVAQAYGVTLPVSSMVLVVVMTLLTSLGTAGIPSASLFSIVVILQTLGLPPEGIGVVMAVERFLDMFRTTVNVLGTSCCAVLVARSEGETVLTDSQPLPQSQ